MFHSIAFYLKGIEESVGEGDKVCDVLIAFTDNNLYQIVLKVPTDSICRHHSSCYHLVLFLVVVPCINMYRN